MKIFVTGVCGQLGFDVVNKALARGYEVIGSDILPGSNLVGTKYVQMDITDAAAVKTVIDELETTAQSVNAVVGSIDMKTLEDLGNIVGSFDPKTLENLDKITSTLDPNTLEDLNKVVASLNDGKLEKLDQILSLFDVFLGR